MIKLHQKLLSFINRARKAGVFLFEFYKIKSAKSKRFRVSVFDVSPHIADATKQTSFDRHYIYHTAWAARVIKESNVTEHVDFSSSLYFSAIISAFVSVRFFDYRPALLGLSGLKEFSADLTTLNIGDNSFKSVSCMHVVEHIGLGRYGDKIDYDGDIKAAQELSRIVDYGGQLLFVVPVAASSYISFNAHRVYGYEQVLSMFPSLSLVEFSLISETNDDLGLVRYASPERLNGEKYGCGCFLFKKIE